MIKSIKNTPCGLRIIEHENYDDKRGNLVKLFHEGIWDSLGLKKPKESFLSYSKKNVLRGLHLQDKTVGQTKYVTCLSGKILDIVVDTRRDSEYFNKPFSIELNGNNPITIEIPCSHAHGFLSRSDETIVHYLSSTEYEKDKDLGFHWKSINYEWPIIRPIVSERDSKLPSLVA